MRPAIVALVSGLKRKGCVAHTGMRRLIASWLDVVRPLSFDHPVFLVCERLRGRSEFKRLVLQLSNVQRG
jgi:hypothetical protein